MLAERYTQETLTPSLAAFGRWHPLPRAAERDAWASLDAAVRATLVSAGEAASREPWPALPATLYLDFVRTGNREPYQTPERQRRAILRRLVLAECAEGLGRFVDSIADALWSICEESTWCWPAHVGVQRAGRDLPDPDEPVVDLGVGESAALVAWSHYLLHDALEGVSPMIPRRVAKEIEQRVLEPCRTRDDFWWMGFTPKRVNNWCPWVVSNWLTCVLLHEPGADARAATVAKALRSLDRFIGEYHSDGGCDEGPSYWGHAGASLFDCLDILHSATDGAVDMYGEPLIANMARYIHRAHIADNWYVNFADAPAQVRPSGGVVYRFGRAVGDEPTMALGRWLWQRAGERAPLEQGSLWRTLRPLFDGESIKTCEPPTAAAPPMVRDVWLDGIEVMVARDHAGSDRGLTVAAKGGHNAESHNHNDVGHFIVYTDGRPALVDAGVGTYIAKTFSPQRYEIWTMQSAYHALPTVEPERGEPVQQSPGREFAARDARHHADDGCAELALDIVGAYPPEANIASWRRRVTLRRGECVTLEDSYELTAPAKALALSLITPCDVDASAAGTLAALRPRDLGNGTTSGALDVHLDGPSPKVSVETIALDDPKLANAWGNKLHRIVLRWPEPAQTGGWTLCFTPA